MRNQRVLRGLFDCHRGRARNIKKAAAFDNWLAPKNDALFNEFDYYFFETFCIYYIPQNYVIQQAMPHAIPQTHASFYPPWLQTSQSSEGESWNKICIGKVKSCKTHRRTFSCVAVLSLWTRTMQVPFVIVLRFYHPDITDKIDRLIHASGSKMALKMSSVVKQLMYVLNFFRVTAGKIHSFRIRSKETLRIIYP